MSSLSLKIIALVFMFTEHFSKYLPQFLPNNFPLYLEYTGRIVAPIFFFLAVEGYHKTSNKRRYLGRLFFWTILMSAGNYAISEFVQWHLQIVSTPENPYFWIWHNIFLSIFLWVAMIWCLDLTKIFFKKHWWKCFLFGIMFVFFAFASLISEASYNGLVMFLVFYFSYGSKKLLAIFYTLLCVLFFAKGFFLNREYLFTFDFQWAMILALPFLLLYNWQRWKYSLKYFFYLFYPIHIWVLFCFKYYLLQ